MLAVDDLLSFYVVSTSEVESKGSSFGSGRDHLHMLHNERHSLSCKKRSKTTGDSVPTNTKQLIVTYALEDGTEPLRLSENTHLQFQRRASSR